MVELVDENIKTVSLNYPIKYMNDKNEQVIIDKVYIGRIKLKHIKAMPPSLFSAIETKDVEKSDEEKASSIMKNLDPKELIPMIASICGLSISNAEEIDIEDLGLIMDALGEQLGNL